MDVTFSSFISLVFDCSFISLITKAASLKLFLTNKQHFCFHAAVKYVFLLLRKKVQVSNDQSEGAVRKRFLFQKPRWEKNKLTIRYLYHEHISADE